MKKTLITTALVLIALVAAFYALNAYIYSEKQADLSEFTSGTYGYRCDDGTEFEISLTADFERMHLVPSSTSDRIGETIIDKVASASGARYEGDGLTFVAHGERVELSATNFATDCNPMTSTDEAPLNFGD